MENDPPPPPDWCPNLPASWQQLLWSLELFTRDVACATGSAFSCSEYDSPFEGPPWHLSFSASNTAVLFPREITELAGHRLPWATCVEVRIQPSPFAEPYQYIDLFVSPLPPHLDSLA